MTEEQIALARRAVACKHWRWAPGMRAIGGCVVATGCPLWLVDGVPRMPVDGEHYMWLRETTDHPDVLPDLTDPATLGCLLYLVREAWGDGGITTQDLDGYDAYGWVCVVDTARLSPGKEYPHTKHGVTWFDGVTEAEALVVALDSAP